MTAAALLTLVVLVALPAVAAWRRRAQSREDSELALELQAFALAVRREAIAAPDPELLARVCADSRVGCPKRAPSFTRWS